MSPENPAPNGFTVMSAAGQQLEAAGIEHGRSDAMRLMAHAFGQDTPRYALMGELQKPLPPEVAARFADNVAARLRRQPVSQIIGSRHFWKQRLLVTPDTLDPRPETEVLVATALSAPFRRLLDLGTGTGAIAIALLDDRPAATGMATDLSEAALAVAARNAATCGVADRLTLQQSDWFEGVEGQFDLIVSNPPYIAAAEMPELAAEVREWEPHLALTPGGDGLDAYRALVSAAPDHMYEEGRLIVEIGPTQGPAVQALFRDAGLVQVQVLPDLDGRDRVVQGRKPARD